MPAWLFTSKPRDTGESHGILKYVRRSIATVDDDPTGLEYAYFDIGLFLIATIARQNPNFNPNPNLSWSVDSQENNWKAKD